MHVSSHARTSVGKYSNEYCLFFEFDRCGTKIKKIKEFIDSAYTEDFFQRLDEDQGQEWVNLSEMFKTLESRAGEVENRWIEILAEILCR